MPIYLHITYLLTYYQTQKYLSRTYHSSLDATKLNDKSLIFIHLFIQMYMLVIINSWPTITNWHVCLTIHTWVIKNNLFVICCWMWLTMVDMNSLFIQNAPQSHQIITFAITNWHMPKFALASKNAYDLKTYGTTNNYSHKISWFGD
jgi:hypothetical protein